LVFIRLGWIKTNPPEAGKNPIFEIASNKLRLKALALIGYFKMVS
jgi:hypothetical protein